MEQQGRHEAVDTVLLYVNAYRVHVLLHQATYDSQKLSE
jgi:hypothetical protein